MLQLFPLLISAVLGQVPGYVVKVDSDTVYLDPVISTTAAKSGQGFIVFQEGAELKNPVTGASLGRMEKNVAEGVLKEIKPKYWVGHLTSSQGVVRQGLRFRLQEEIVPSLPSDSRSAAALKQPWWKSPALDALLVGIAIADADGDGRSEILATDKSQLTIYKYSDKQLKPLAHFKSKDRILSLDAADSAGIGRAHIFLTTYNDFFKRIQSIVLEFKGDRLEKIDSLHFMVRILSNAPGPPRLWGQELVEDRAFPLSNIVPLVWKKDRYVPDGSKSKIPRIDWLYGFTLADWDGDGEEDPLTLTSFDRLRFKFKKGSWESSTDFGKTPNRIRWQDSFLKFSPHFLTYQKGEDHRFYASRNIPKRGILADSFGNYDRSEIHSLKWNGSGLETAWQIHLDGTVSDMALGPLDLHPFDLIAAVVGINEKSTLWFFTPE
ncbi:MAG: hypothetical protein HY400_00855 [Elusimicrobia bacterium]|nr:hypothetical protein [Elusimicrobiota bacterium]